MCPNLRLVLNESTVNHDVGSTLTPDLLTSASGYKQTFKTRRPDSDLWMSAYPPKADVIGCSAECPLLTQSGHPQYESVTMADTIGPVVFQQPRERDYRQWLDHRLSDQVLRGSVFRKDPRLGRKASV